MTRRRPTPFAVRLRRWLVVGVALLGYLTGAVGVPVPASIVQDVSQPFPCQGHACGCGSAAQCWNSCCCYTPQQKLAWAERNGVTPPSSAGGWQAVRLRDREKVVPVEPKPSCCQSGHCASSTPKAEPKPAPTRGIVWTTAMAARSCRGLATDWVSAPSVVPPLSVTWTYDWTPAGWLTTSSTTAHALPSSPAAPPPRV